MNSLVLSLTVQSRWNCQQPITGPPRPPTFWLFPSGLVTATSSATVEPCIFSILFSHTNQPHVLLHYTHKSPVGSSSRHPAKHFQPQPHPFTSIFTITWLLHGQTMSDISGFLSKTSSMLLLCPSDLLLPDAIRPGDWQRSSTHHCSHHHTAHSSSNNTQEWLWVLGINAWQFYSTEAELERHKA